MKRYHIGYVAGVFDLFHIGHLNLLRRAKEQCDYLIAGVVTDEQVINTKKTRPYIPFEERLAIVQACRYVDEAVEIPIDRPDTQDAYYMYHFDAQFSGSDYADDSYWLSKKLFLQQHGSDLVFFPYTEGISSTGIKEQLRNDKKL
ncbi:MAG: adenylyltransferase/cytidyltransferase family protein [Lachnospiraceae bacterium]|nr:adenylyltransferase/cytidyltransferase family protein [Lachnospiraceae bacterium]